MGESRDFADVFSEQGPDAVANAPEDLIKRPLRPVGAPEDAGDCPVRPLGHRDGVYYVLSPSGELRTFTQRSANAMGLVSLSDGNLEWWETCFPTSGKRKNDGKVQFVQLDAASWLIQECVRLGLWDANTPVRGPGVWRGPPDVGLIVHCGDRLLIDGEWRAAGQIAAGVLYPAAHRIARPASVPASTDLGRRLHRLLETWNYREPWGVAADGSPSPLGADLVLGYIGQALLGAAPAWRPHMMLTGPRGSGKSELSDTVAAALGPGAHPSTNNFSEAGLRQALTGEARALILDESEPDNSGRVEKVVELLRHMSSGEGARALRGSSGGQHRAYHVTGSAFLSSIIHVPLSPQDRSRIAEVMLGKLQTDAGASARVRAAIAEIREQANALRARAIASWSLFQDCYERYRSALHGAGCDDRQADQLGTFLAGRDLLLQDSPPDDDSLDLEMARWRPYIEAIQEVDEQEGEGEQCLSHLYSSPISLPHGGARHTVASFLIECLEGGAQKRDLQKLGLKLYRKRPTQPWLLLVANDHNALKNLFADTRWRGGGWSQALRMLKDVAAHEALNIDGMKRRSTGLPNAYLPVSDPPEPSEPPPSEGANG